MIKNIVTRIFETFPYLEVISKHLLARTSIRGSLKNIVLGGNNRKRVGNKDIFIQELDRIDINPGDVLILHSSVSQLSSLDISPVWILKYLLGRLGDSGTLVIPTFPLYDVQDSTPLVYDVQRTPSWTGLLPNIFLRYPGVIRSRFPYNTLAAVGPLANELMSNNLSDCVSYGPNSAWVKCIKYHAKVLFLGTPAFHTTTISHIPEDLLGEKWPIRDFHKPQKFKIVSKDGTEEFTAYLRDEKWAKNLKSHYRTKLLRDRAFLSEKIIEGVYVGFIPDSKVAVDLLCELAENGKTMYYVPGKYKK